MKKILSFILSFLLISGNVCFASSEIQFWTLDNFSGGENSHISALKTPDNQAVSAVNVRVNDEFSSISKREVLITAWDVGSATVNGLHRYYKSDGTSKVIMATGTTLEIGDAGATTTTTICSGLTDGKDWQFITFKDKAIGTNGYDQPIKYDGETTTTANTDGARTAGELCAQLGAPFAELDTGTDLDASSWYQYKIAWYDGSTYDYSTTRSNPILTGADVHNIALTDVPIGPTGTTHRYIYRTLGNSSKANVKADTTFYLVGTIADNSTTTFSDDVTDDTADDDAAPTWSTASAGSNATPPTGTIINLHIERAFIAGNTTYHSDLYWSDDGNPDHFLPTDYIAIREDDGDEITFVKTILGLQIVGKTNSIQRFYTDSSETDEWEASGVYSFIGCPAPYSVAVTPLGIFYLGRNGIYRFDGNNSYLISDAVSPHMKDISQTDIETTAGVFFNNEFRLAYTSTESGETHNNRVLVYNLTRDAYTVDYEEVNCWTAFQAGSDFGGLYSGTSDTDGYVVGHFPTTNLLSKRYKSEFDAGTFDDVATFNTEDEPYLELSWDCTIDGWDTEAGKSTIDELSGNIDRPDEDGTWTSPTYYINASALDKLYWNEILGAYGDLTFQIRLDSDTDFSGISWNTAVTNPNGSDISSITANDYIQVRANFSTSDEDYTSRLYYNDGYVFKLTFSKIGSENETSMLSLWRTGWKDFGVRGYKKLLRRIKVFYKGTSGDLTIAFRNEEGDIDRSFDIDMSVLPTDDINDAYTGEGDLKVYTYLPPINSSSVPSAIGQFWQFDITDTGVVDWDVDRIEVAYQVEEYYD